MPDELTINFTISNLWVWVTMYVAMAYVIGAFAINADVRSSTQDSKDPGFVVFVLFVYLVTPLWLPFAFLYKLLFHGVEWK